MKSIIKVVGEDYFISSLPETYKKAEPVKNRGKLPSIRINAELGVWQHLPLYLEAGSYFYLHQLVKEGPLVISTYSPSWNNYGEKHLLRLKKAYPTIQNLGGNLLVLTTEYFKNIVYTVQKYDLDFNLLQDINLQISAALGVYSEFEPVWDRIAGISEEVPFPATFVVNAEGRVVYDYIDKDFEFVVSDKEIEKAVKIASVSN
ncbi:peroxiredoxin family protein [Runella zeae]|uniref:peroxiredoxin family protein n=1 Tax=Runella zeae TaxID=94255 RepID=UPI0004064714|nr:redoxin domain-containing protein [Runella zeae]